MRNEMNKLVWTVTSVAVAASIAITVAIEQQSANRRRADAESLFQEETQMVEARLENARLSNIVSQASSAQPLSHEQLTELLRLRNEVNQLRGVPVEKSRLEATNASLRDLDAKSQKALAAARALPNYWPRSQLTFAGFSDPESGAKSVLAAMNNGDIQAFLNSLDPSMSTNFEAELKKELGDTDDIKRNLRDFLSDADGFHIVGETTNGGNDVDVEISFDGTNLTRKVVMVMRKTGGEWKYIGH